MSWIHRSPSIHGKPCRWTAWGGNAAGTGFLLLATVGAETPSPAGLRCSWVVFLFLRRAIVLVYSLESKYVIIDMFATAF